MTETNLSITERSLAIALEETLYEFPSRVSRTSSFSLSGMCLANINCVWFILFLAIVVFELRDKREGYEVEETRKNEANYPTNEEH